MVSSKCFNEEVPGKGNIQGERCTGKSGDRIEGRCRYNLEDIDWGDGRPSLVGEDPAFEGTKAWMNYLFTPIKTQERRRNNVGRRSQARLDSALSGEQ